MITRTVYIGILMSAVAVALFLVAVGAAGETLTGAARPDPAVIAEAQRLAVTALALFQVFYLLTCRTLKAPVRSAGWWSNSYVFAGIGLLLALQAGFMYLPFMQDLFGTAPLSAGQWALATCAGAVVVPVVALEKFVRRRRTSTTRRGTAPSSTPGPGSVVVDTGQSGHAR